MFTTTFQQLTDAVFNPTGAARCDICYVAEVTHLWPCKDFRVNLPVPRKMVGDWALCGACTPLAARGDFSSLNRRAQAMNDRNGIPRHFSKPSVDELFRGLRKHVAGTPEPTAAFSPRQSCFMKDGDW